MIIKPLIIKIPQFIPFAIVAFNITAFTVLLQMDWLIFDSVADKAVAWAATIGAWYIAYLKRYKLYILRM